MAGNKAGPNIKKTNTCKLHTERNRARKKAIMKTRGPTTIDYKADRQRMLANREEKQREKIIRRRAERQGVQLMTDN